MVIISPRSMQEHCILTCFAAFFMRVSLAGIDPQAGILQSTVQDRLVLIATNHSEDAGFNCCEVR